MDEARPHGVRRARPGTAAAILTTAWSVGVALLIILLGGAGCGGGAVTSGDPLAGFWLGGGSAEQMTMIQVGVDGGEYVVLTNPDAPAGHAVKKGDSLVIESHAVTTTLTPAGQDRLSATFTGEMFATPQPVVLRRVTRTEYADASVAHGIATLQRGLAMWEAGGGEEYPPAREVAADGLLGEMVRWPSNPFTGGPMKQGDEPGEFTYRLLRGGKDYSLVGHLSDGGVVGD